jgi:hypothetical protein
MLAVTDQVIWSNARARPKLSEAECLESLGSVPERREINRAGYQLGPLEPQE